MLTEILDRWEILRELRQQQTTWQQRWDLAQANYQAALTQLETADRQRLHAVLSEILAENQPVSAAAPRAFQEAPPLPTTLPTPTDLALDADPAFGRTARPSSPIPAVAPADGASPPADGQDWDPAPAAGAPDTAPGDLPAAPSSQAKSPGGPPSPPPPTGTTPAEPADPHEALLQWATETIGDGVSENVLFQALRKSPFAAKASDLFKILESRDAFYDTDDGDILVRSLRTTHV
jgi:hypothetical protein